jgi:hypothetical protein
MPPVHPRPPGPPSPILNKPDRTRALHKEATTSQHTWTPSWRPGLEYEIVIKIYLPHLDNQVEARQVEAQSDRQIVS